MIIWYLCIGITFILIKLIDRWYTARLNLLTLYKLFCTKEKLRQRKGARERKELFSWNLNKKHGFLPLDTRNCAILSELTVIITLTLSSDSICNLLHIFVLPRICPVTCVVFPFERGETVHERVRERKIERESVCMCAGEWYIGHFKRVTSGWKMKMCNITMRLRAVVEMFNRVCVIFPFYNTYCMFSCPTNNISDDNVENQVKRVCQKWGDIWDVTQINLYFTLISFLFLVTENWIIEKLII